eukprot:5194173-Amphidinium_carterae.1
MVRMVADQTSERTTSTSLADLHDGAVRQENKAESELNPDDHYARLVAGSPRLASISERYSVVYDYFKVDKDEWHLHANIAQTAETARRTLLRFINDIQKLGNRDTNIRESGRLSATGHPDKRQSSDNRYTMKRTRRKIYTKNIYQCGTQRGKKQRTTRAHGKHISSQKATHKKSTKTKSTRLHQQQSP